MQNYTLQEAKAKQEEILKKAKNEPVLLSEQSHPSHIIMSVQAYQELINRIHELEDMVLAKQAIDAVGESEFVGEEEFMRSLQELANA
ncbi:MAG: type II toxin-antitoxin system Phd/YefM family antitoxin [Cyanobacteria bacterium SBLK]|nr:type II toxin-antitoxin system Phd/YefM family antitoxin [Cyanobacteria bacterium SBLK]